MKYSVEIDVNVPRHRFVELFDDPQNLPKWQQGLLSIEHLSGAPGQPGAKSRLLFAFGKRTMEMIETITKRDLPTEFNGTYEAPGFSTSLTIVLLRSAPTALNGSAKTSFSLRRCL